MPPLANEETSPPVVTRQGGSGHKVQRQICLNQSPSIVGSPRAFHQRVGLYLVARPSLDIGLYPGPGIVGAEFKLDKYRHDILLALLQEAVPNARSLLCAHIAQDLAYGRQASHACVTLGPCEFQVTRFQLPIWLVWE